MIIDSETRDDSLLLTIQDTRIDAAAAVRFKEQIRQMVTGSEGRVIIDLTTVEFLDSSGLGALVAIMKMLGGRKLELAGSGTVVRKVFALTRMDSVFVLHDTVKDALGSSRDAA